MFSSRFNVNVCGSETMFGHNGAVLSSEKGVSSNVEVFEVCATVKMFVHTSVVFFGGPTEFYDSVNISHATASCVTGTTLLKRLTNGILTLI